MSVAWKRLLTPNRNRQRKLTLNWQLVKIDSDLLEDSVFYPALTAYLLARYCKTGIELIKRVQPRFFGQMFAFPEILFFISLGVTVC
uniref:Uncharacterized protein n=1 Tax=Tolypothrix bouteillei VB521301 TaxID=1479485 RepID=A0A0C1N649_9CYAN